MKGFCDPMGQTRILWVHSTRVCLGPKTITHLHLTIVALNYHLLTRGLPALHSLPGCTAVMKSPFSPHPLSANMCLSLTLTSRT